MSYDITVRLVQGPPGDTERPFRRRFDILFDCEDDNPASGYKLTIEYTGASAPKKIVYATRIGGRKYRPSESRVGSQYRWTFYTKCPARPYCGPLQLSLRVHGTDIFTNEEIRSDAQPTVTCAEQAVSLPAADEPWQGGVNDIDTLIAGDYFRKGSYHTPDTHVHDPEGYEAGNKDKDGFKNQNLQGWLEDTIADLKAEYPTDEGVQNLEWHHRIAADTWSGGGDSEHSGKEGTPAWVSVFQKKTAGSSKWDRPDTEKQLEKICSRLLGAFYNAFFVEKVLGPFGYPMPANVEHFLKHLGKSESNTPPNWKADIGGSTTDNWCAASASRAMQHGTAHYGYKVTDQPAGGVYPEHGVRVYNHAFPRTKDRQSATDDDVNSLHVLHAVKPGDVLSVRTAGSPPSGHVVTVILPFDHDDSGNVIPPTFDPSKGADEKQLRLWYVSGNANEQVRVDYVWVVNKRPGKSEYDPNYDKDKDTVPGPASGHVTIINRVFDHQLQPEHVVRMGTNLCTKRHIDKLPGVHPAPNKPGELAEQSQPAPESGPSGTAAAATLVDVPAGCYLPKEIWVKETRTRKKPDGTTETYTVDVLRNCIDCFTVCKCCSPGPAWRCTVGKPANSACQGCEWALYL